MLPGAGAGRQAGFCSGLCHGTVRTGILGLLNLWHVTGLQHTTAEKFYMLRWAKDSQFSLWHSVLVCSGRWFTRTLNWIWHFFPGKICGWKARKLASTCQNRALWKTSKVVTHEQICLCGLDLHSQVVTGTCHSQANQPGWRSELMYPCSFWS